MLTFSLSIIYICFRLGKPIFLSLPHFLYGSDFLLEQVSGLNPSKEEHETFVDVEPVSKTNR